MTDELERSYELLTAHPDFIVLRRLPIRSCYHPSDGRQLRVGLVLDTETTGLETTDKVIEIGLLRFEFDEVTGDIYSITDTYSALEDPGMRISPQAMAVHGITDAMVRGKKFDDARVTAMSARVDLVIAHNARFDRPMIEKRYPLFAKVNWACSYLEIDWKGIGYGSSSLEFIAGKSGFFYEAHGAEMDCRALLEILHKSFSPGEKRILPFMKQLVTASRRVEERIWALNAPFDKKDALKQRGYRWNAENPKCWWTSVARTDGRAEKQWLLKNVYDSNSATMRVDMIDALSRYSGRLTDSRTRKVTLDERDAEELTLF